MQIIDSLYLKKKAKYITLSIVYTIFVFWMLLNGEAFLGYWESSWTFSILFYLLGVTAFLSVAEKLPVDLKKPVSDSIFGFLIAFPLFTVIFFVIAQSGLYFQGIVPLPSHMVVPTIIYQVGIVAASEEIIFRGVIFRLFHKINPYLGYFGSSALFAAFHWAAYGGSYPALLIAFAMGIILALLTKYFNIGVAIGMHSSYNAFLIGATAIIFLTA